MGPCGIWEAREAPLPRKKGPFWMKTPLNRKFGTADQEKSHTFSEGPKFQRKQTGRSGKLRAGKH